MDRETRWQHEKRQRGFCKSALSVKKSPIAFKKVEQEAGNRSNPAQKLDVFVD
jgi:hypothetical protein